VICHYDTNQTVDSSPAIGGFLAGGATGEVTGTGSYWPGASDTDTVKAFDPSCNQTWSTTLDGYTDSSPALADVLGNGQLQVIEGTDHNDGNPGTGSVYALDGATGAVLWKTSVVGRVVGSVVTADLSGSGHQGRARADHPGPGHPRRGHRCACRRPGHRLVERWHSWAPELAARDQ